MTSIKRKILSGIKPTQRIVIGFLLIITVGAILLSLPISSNSGKATDPLTAAFTSVSATCVTGLIKVDTALHWNFFGEIVILTLIQIGGLGVMTIAVLFFSKFKKHTSISDRMTVASSYNLFGLGDVMIMLKRIIKGTLTFEAIGAILLSIRFIPLFGFSEGLWKSIFHSVSAFCNAGFDIMGEYSGEYASLADFADDPLVSLTIAALLIIGGIGFVVWDDIYGFLKSRKKFSPHAKLVIIITVFLLVFGTVTFIVCEWNNPSTIGSMDLKGKLTASFFQSATTRTAGYSTVNLTGTQEITKLAFCFLMFVGGSPGSTAGGVKTATIGVILITIYDVIRGHRQTVIFKRTVLPETVNRAFTIMAIHFLLTITGVIVLMAQRVSLLPALFECFSASATVGLSLSITPGLPAISTIMLMILMFVGRVGIMTFMYAMKKRAIDMEEDVQYSPANFLIG